MSHPWEWCFHTCSENEYINTHMGRQMNNNNNNKIQYETSYSNVRRNSMSGVINT